MKLKAAICGFPKSLLPGVSGGRIERPRKTCSLKQEQDGESRSTHPAPRFTCSFIPSPFCPQGGPLLLNVFL